MSVGDPITKQCFTDVARQSLRGLPAGTMRVLGFVLAECAERVLGFVLAERAERVLGFVERQNRCKAILCSELQSISAILSFCKENVSGFGFKLYGRARRARVGICEMHKTNSKSHSDLQRISGTFCLCRICKSKLRVLGLGFVVERAERALGFLKK